MGSGSVVRPRQAGFTYLGVLALVAIMGAALGATAEVWHIAQQREKERQLLFAGQQFRLAIERYYLNSPGKDRRYPNSLDDLLKDPRHPDTRRYLRRIWRDPFTGEAEWGLVRGRDGGIVGVHSLSGTAPLKRANFGPGEAGFEAAASYADWVFMSGARPAGRTAPAPEAD